jgi:3-deoxy-D-manno-octulosonic-acid transferase
VTAIVPFVQALRLRFPGYQIVVTTVTETGREAVEQRLAGLAMHAYAPLDFPWAVRRSIQRLQPSLFVFVETELWPNLLRALGRHGVPAILVNGRLSSRSFVRYRMLRFFFSQVLRHVRLALVQSDRDRQRFVSIGAVPNRVIRTGNLKFDQPPPQTAATAPDRRALGLADHEQLIVAGSTHPGEEEQLLDAYRSLHSSFPSLVLLLAPRHIERAASLETTVKEKGFEVVRRSRLAGSQISGPRVIVLDTRGELPAVYRHGVATFVGGTLVPVGGHNLLEPAVWGKPVFFGSHTDHCAEMADLLLLGGGAVRVADGRELASLMAGLLKDGHRLKAMGAAAQQVVLDNRGAVQRTLDLLGAVLQEPSRDTVQPAMHAMPREPREPSEIAR